MVKRVAVLLVALCVSACCTHRAATECSAGSDKLTSGVEGAGWISPTAYRATRDAEAYYSAHRTEILRAHPEQYVFIFGGRVYGFPGLSWIDAYDAAKGISPSGGGYWVGTWPRQMQ